MKLTNEPPLLEEMYERLRLLRGSFSSRREYESVIQLMWAGVPELIARDRLAGDSIQDKEVYEFDPIGMNVIRSKPIHIWEQILLPAEEKLDLVLSRGYNFLFYGANGSGKTHSATQFLCTALETGYSGYYITLRDLYLLFNEVSFKDHSKSQSDLLAYILKASVLVIDEVGKESLSAPIISFIEDTLKSRSVRPCSTLMCSNIQVHKQEFLARYGNSVWDILRGNYFIYHFAASGDYRMKFRKTLDLS